MRRREPIGVRVVRRYAASFDSSQGRGRLFRIHGRELYDAIGEPHSRFRRPPPIARAIERCMLLDVVLAHPDVVWFAPHHAPAWSTEGRAR